MGGNPSRRLLAVDEMQCEYLEPSRGLLHSENRTSWREERGVQSDPRGGTQASYAAQSALWGSRVAVKPPGLDPQARCCGEMANGSRSQGGGAQQAELLSALHGVGEWF